jgi:hypothetical protein
MLAWRLEKQKLESSKFDIIWIPSESWCFLCEPVFFPSAWDFSWVSSPFDLLNEWESTSPHASFDSLNRNIVQLSLPSYLQERLLGTLQPEEIDKILRSFGWAPPDLARGYMVQVSL